MGGPQVLANHADARDRLLSEIIKYAHKESLIFALLESIQSIKYPKLIPFTAQTKYLLEPTTRLIDLTGSTEEILADMKQKGRYNIKIAEK